MSDADLTAQGGAGAKPYVVYWNNIPAPYMVERFNTLARRNKVEIEAWFTDREDPDRSWEINESAWHFPYRYLKPVPLTRGKLKRPRFGGRRPDLLISLYAEPSYIFGWALARFLRIPIAFWCETTFDSWVPRSRWKDAIKHVLFDRVDATLGTGEQCRAFAHRCGTPWERTLNLPPVIDVDYFRRESQLPEYELAEHRTRLGLEGSTFIYVGRLWEGKGIDFLVDAFADVQHAVDKPVSLLLIGDGPDEGRLQEKCDRRGLENVVFSGFVQKPQLPLYYALADVFVFPTLGDPYGLAVDEAMACGLPVVSTTTAGEIDTRVSNGENGFLVPPRDSSALSKHMKALATDEKLRRHMGEMSEKRIEGKTPERWAQTFEGLVDQILAMPRR